MAKTKKLFGANENPTNDLTQNTVLSGDGFPITFGKGEWADGVFAQIAAKDDSDTKIRFVYSIDGTKSGAIYAGNKLASSAILSITTNETAETKANQVTIKYIDVDDNIAELSFGVVDPDDLDSLMAALEERIDALETWAKDSSTLEEAVNGAITVTPGNGTFSSYEIGVNVDNSTVKVVDDKLAVAEWTLAKLDNTSEGYSAQYQLQVLRPGETEYVGVGDTIDILKDFFLKDAHVCTFNKALNPDTLEVTDWAITDPTKIDSLGDVYAVVNDEEYSDASGYIRNPETGELDTENPVFLEKAPKGQGLYLNHTYLHLIVNTSKNDETGEEGKNDSTTDVYLDFTEIINAGVFGELKEQVESHETRLNTIESSYVKGVNIPESDPTKQFKTITISTNTTEGVVDSSFVIADSSYYETVQANFTQLQANDDAFKSALTWGGLE